MTEMFSKFANGIEQVDCKQTAKSIKCSVVFDRIEEIEQSAGFDVLDMRMSTDRTCTRRFFFRSGKKYFAATEETIRPLIKCVL